MTLIKRPVERPATGDPGRRLCVPFPAGVFEFLSMRRSPGRSADLVGHGLVPRHELGARLEGVDELARRREELALPRHGVEVADGDAEQVVDRELLLEEVRLRDEEPGQELGLDGEELEDVDLLALVRPRPNVHEEARQVVAQEARAHAEARAQEQRACAKAHHHEELPGLGVRQLLQDAHIRPDEVDREQVREAEGPVEEKGREWSPELELLQRRPPLEEKPAGVLVVVQHGRADGESQRRADVDLRHRRRSMPRLEHLALERLLLKVGVAHGVVLGVLVEDVVVHGIVIVIVVVGAAAAAQREERVPRSPPLRERGAEAVRPAV
mmetsp:Transcript_5844/g.21009  ORF Transcript_5844/g.21009 Transcript_5844/m.21009 type:complete len:326 (-) Transcript_5844:11-988(-)